MCVPNPGGLIGRTTENQTAGRRQIVDLSLVPAKCANRGLPAEIPEANDVVQACGDALMIAREKSRGQFWSLDRFERSQNSPVEHISQNHLSIRTDG